MTDVLSSRRLIEDNRLAGNPRLVLQRTGAPSMQIPDSIRKCVAFLYCRRNSGMQAMGTVFFVSHIIDDFSDLNVVYAVTARHVIEKISALGIDAETYFRINKRGGGTDSISMPCPEWTFAERLGVDVAVASVPFSFETHDIRYISDSMFLDVGTIDELQIGPGDELFFPGLFKHHVGESANIPIMRVGNIAAMPVERIHTEKHGPIRAYLAEARSIGGLSGSPVFVHMGSRWFVEEHYKICELDNEHDSGYLTYYFLGMVQGHFCDRDEFDSADGDSIDDGSGVRSVNMGIAIVIPADEILEVLMQSDLVSEREKFLKDHIDKRTRRLPVDD